MSEVSRARLVLKRDRIEKRIAALSRERDDVVMEIATLDGFKPCSDCAGGWCTMNCSSAPMAVKVMA